MLLDLVNIGSSQSLAGFNTMWKIGGNQLDNGDLGYSAEWIWGPWSLC